MRRVRSITARMTAGTAAVLAVVLTAVYGWRHADFVEARRDDLRADAQLTAKLVLRSFEGVEPGKSRVHADYLARNLVELPAIHNIIVVAEDGTVAYSHHPDEVGRRFDPPTDAVCAGCHTAATVLAESREYTSRDGQPLFHEGFPIPNERACHRCHDPREDVLGMLLMSLELGPLYADLARWRSSLVWSVVAAIVASLLSLWALFRALVRRPLGRLARDIRGLEGGDFDHLLGPRGSDEIAAVHASFIAMAGRLRDAQAALEASLREDSARIDSLSGELDLLYSNLMHLEHLSALGTLSAQMAHEIRTPLNAMGLSLQLLERNLATPAAGDDHRGGAGAVELLADMSREVERIVATLNQLMLRVRRPVPDPAPEPAGAVVDSTVFLIGAEARRAGVALDAQVASDVRRLPVHATHLRQILTNLMSNAVKATPRGGRVRVRAFLDAGRVCVTVEDSGPGVPAELRQRILEPFFTTRADGTGLGLAIVAHILAECDGRLVVGGSAELGGAAFDVILGDCAPPSGSAATGAEANP